MLWCLPVLGVERYKNGINSARGLLALAFWTMCHRDSSVMSQEVWSPFLMLVPSCVTRLVLFSLSPVAASFSVPLCVLVPVRGFVKCLVTFPSSVRA